MMKEYIRPQVELVPLKLAGSLLVGSEGDQGVEALSKDLSDDCWFFGEEQENDDQERHVSLWDE